MNDNKITKNYLYKLIPIGGVGEIGHNMTLVETPKRSILIDAGILFARDTNCGLNYLTPDFSVLDKTKTYDIIITHAHEDHIGAIPHLLEHLPKITIHASKFAKQILLLKAISWNIELKIQEYNENSILNFEEIIIYPIKTNHSIPETFGILIQDKSQKVSTCYFSDWKFDKTELYERKTNFKKIIQLSKSSEKRLLFSDSTNIESIKNPLSEKNIFHSLFKIIKKRKKRVFITFFPSNIFRLQTIIEIAIKTNKKIFLHGRSFEQFSSTAIKLGLLKNYNKAIINNSKNSNDNDDNLIILLTGSQGNFLGSFSRVITNKDSIFSLKKDDLIIYSSKIIPGNENNVNFLINKIYEKEAKIILPEEAPIHTSGHAGQKDIRMFINKYMPTDIFPIHGTYKLLYKHREYIKNNFKKVQTHLINNFDEVIIEDKQNIKINKLAESPAPLFYLENGVKIDKSSLKERKKISRKGIIFCSIIIKQDNNITIEQNISIKIKFLGVPEKIIDKKQDLEKYIINEFPKYYNYANEEKNYETIREIISEFIKKFVIFKPHIILHIF